MQADNGQRIEYIETQAALEDSCRHWLTLSVIALDTEFMRTNTFYPKLGLLQVADDSQCYLIDPLKINDWSCFLSVLTNPGCDIVLHSAGEDLVTLLVAFGQLPVVFFDTQIASAYAGLGFSLSYQALVRELIGRELPKDQTRSDWLKRPLSESQLKYAANDVCYLLPIYRELSSRLDTRGYLGFLRGDARAQLNTTKLAEQSDNWALSYTTVSNSWRLSDLALACLQRLCVWREVQARKRNLPRSWIAKDAELLAIAQLVRENRKLAVGDLNDCAAPVSALVKNDGDKLIRLVNSPPDFSLIDRSLLSHPLPASLRGLIKGFRQTVQKHAEQMDISPELLARKKQLVAVAQNMQSGSGFVWPPELGGWRRDRLAADFLEVAGKPSFKEVTENG